MLKRLKFLYFTKLFLQLLTRNWVLESLTNQKEILLTFSKSENILLFLSIRKEEINHLFSKENSTLKKSMIIWIFFHNNSFLKVLVQVLMINLGYSKQFLKFIKNQLKMFALDKIKLCALLLSPKDLSLKRQKNY